MDSPTSKQNPQNSETGPASAGSNRRLNVDQENYFNSQFDARPVYLEPGQTIWSNLKDEMIVATVGNGVTVSINDTDLQMGVLGYVLMPDRLLEAFPYFDKADPEDLKKAFAPIDTCVGEMKRHGAGKSRIRIRLIGAGAIPGDNRDASTKNAVFTREYINRKGLPVFNEDIGGSYIRRVHFFPTTGRCVRRMLRRQSDFDLIKDVESEYQHRLATKK